MANKVIICISQSEFKQITNELIASGYKIESKGYNKTFFIKRKKKEHLKIFLLTVWFTFGIGNIIYSMIPGKIEDYVLVKYRENVS